MDFYLDELLMLVEDEDRTCGNCKFWDANKLHIDGHDVALCRKRAVPLPDAGEGGIAFLGKPSTCSMISGKWEPSDDFIEELKDRKAREDLAAYYGVRPGIDFPATMGMVI